jgi:hypothetical protein
MMATRANKEGIMRMLIAAGADPKPEGAGRAYAPHIGGGSSHVGVLKYAYEFDQDVKAAIAVVVSTLVLPSPSPGLHARGEPSRQEA